jgi:Protein of unknown function (DUF5818)
MTLRRILMVSLALAMSGCALFHNRSRGDEATPLNNPIAPTIIATGTVSTSGVECPAVRGADGKTYTVATPAPMALRANTQVRVTGSQAQVSTCQQGTTVRATSIENLSATVIDPTAVPAPSTSTTRR